MLIALLLHVALAVPPASAVAPALVHTALAEAAGLWSPYGVAVAAAAPSDCGHAHDDSILLLVVAVVDPAAVPLAAPPGWRGALGEISFGHDGAPASAITVFVSDIERLIVGARPFAAFGWRLPAVLHDLLVGRVMGRVLAHEIGHYLLRSPRHAARGLMGPLQLADDLVSPSRHRFTLTAADTARLEHQR